MLYTPRPSLPGTIGPRYTVYRHSLCMIERWYDGSPIHLPQLGRILNNHPPTPLFRMMLLMAIITTYRTNCFCGCSPVIA